MDSGQIDITIKIKVGCCQSTRNLSTDIDQLPRREIACRVVFMHHHAGSGPQQSLIKNEQVDVTVAIGIRCGKVPGRHIGSNFIPRDQRSGTISKILVSDAQPVEFDEPLCIIE